MTRTPRMRAILAILFVVSLFVFNFTTYVPLLARSFQSSPDGMNSPTLSVHATKQGVVLGTAAYMSPEQARGLPVDRRTDIWAFGCVFYEMLTGRLAFSGETVSDTIGRILEREPDWSAVPASTPPAIVRVLRRCFAKDPRQRVRDIGDVRIEIDAVGEPSSEAIQPLVKGGRFWPLAAVAARLPEARLGRRASRLPWFSKL